MENKEKNCKWHFGNEGGIDIGPNDPIHNTFKGNVYYSIVRESIQNSLDAVSIEREPVKVVFSSFRINRSDFPNLFEIEKHITQCQTFYHDNVDAKRLFKDMLDNLNGERIEKLNVHKKQELSCMKISDYNTGGMKYDKNDTKSRFYAFLRAAGVTSKSNQGAGGSFGFGKGAYFALSPIKTLIVSSMDTDGNVYFEGTTRLTTHKNESGEKRTAYGFYDSNDGEPVQDINSIPDIFKREKAGTDISIIGLWKEEDQESIMVKSVLNNFWLAIYQNKLIVQIKIDGNDITIEKSKLEQIIDEYFEEECEGNSPNDIETWNPKSYFKAVKYAGTSSEFPPAFEKKLETLGNVELYVYLEKELQSRISYFRKPKMVVCKKTNKKINGYSAVFICESDEGNELLRLMENPAHNEWKKENYPKEEGHISPIARKAENEISKFINESLEELSKVKIGKKIAFLGLEEYLSIPEDLLEKDDIFDYEGNSSNNVSGSSSSETTEEETGSQTTVKRESVKIKATPIIKNEVPEETEIEPTEDGSEKVTVGGENTTSGGNANPTDSGDTATTGKRADDTTPNPPISKILVNVKLRVLAQKTTGIIEHILFVDSPKEIANVELEFSVGADNGKEDDIAIISSDTGTIEKNILKNVNLQQGKNIIKIKFADNVKHSIKLKAYEYEYQ